MSARTIIRFAWSFSGDPDRAVERYRVVVEPIEAHEGYRASQEMVLEPEIHVERLHKDCLGIACWQPLSGADALNREGAIMCAFARLPTMVVSHLEPWNMSTAKKTLPKGWLWDQDAGAIVIDVGTFEGRP
jgi:hypothetical protein